MPNEKLTVGERKQYEQCLGQCTTCLLNGYCELQKKIKGEKMKPIIRLFLETDEHGREYFKHDREAATQLVKDAIAATEEDGIVRRVGYEVSRNGS